MSRISPKVWKVWHRYGTLQATPLLDVPYLPYLPYLPTRRRAGAHPRIYARARNTIYLWKVWKVWKEQCQQGLQGSIPLPYLRKVWK